MPASNTDFEAYREAEVIGENVFLKYKHSC